MSKVTSEDDLGAARKSLVSGQWADAREQFTAVLAAGERAEALDGMGTALWWLGEVRASLGYRERGYVRYRGDGRHAEASMVALDISVCYLTSLENPAAARGWIARAHRAATASGEDRMAGWIWLMNGYISDDAQEQQQLLSRALDFARRTGDVDLELVALADLGPGLVSAGAVHDGLGMLDEAMAGTLGGEYQRLETVVWTSCSMLAACSLVGDLTRGAAQPTHPWNGSAARSSRPAAAHTTAESWSRPATGSSPRASSARCWR